MIIMKWFFCLFSMFYVSEGIHLQHDLENYMQDLDFTEEDSSLLVDAPDPDLGFEENEASLWSSEGDDEGVRRLWGVSDTSITIGQLLIYPIPKDAFAGPVERYIIKGKESSLPSWMFFNEEANSLEGVPTGTDIGAHYVKVVAVGAASKAKDTFVVEVMPSIPSVPVTQSCGVSRISVFNLLLDVSLEKLSGKERVALFNNTARFLPVAEERMRLVREDDIGNLMNDVETFDSGLVGPGDSARQRQNGAVLQWQVGCEGGVSNAKQLEMLSENAKDGTLHEVTGYPVIGWYINTVNLLLSRESREVGSGDHDSYYETTEEMPASRMIPSLVSPVHIPDAVPVSPHPHRHGHQGGRRFSATPAYFIQPTSTPVLPPVMPTATVSGSIPELTVTPSEELMSSSEFIEPSPSVDFTETDIVLPSMVPPDMSESTETSMGNFPPSIAQRLKFATVEEGQVFRFKIPEGTFQDFEDNHDLELKLRDKNHVDLDAENSWVQFDEEKKEVYGLALSKYHGTHNYQLYAYDMEGKYVNESLRIRIQQSSDTRKDNHKFNMAFSVDNKSKYPNKVYWELDILDRLRKLFGDQTTDNFRVESINLKAANEDAYIITWRNITLIEGCPRKEILKLYKFLSEEKPKPSGGKPSKKLMRVADHDYSIESVGLELMKKFCEPITTDPSPGAGKSMSPVLENDIDKITAVVGELLSFIVPQDTFHDTEDGGTENLNLTLSEMKIYRPLKKSSWLQFDSRNREFYGVPLESDIGSTEYNLKCTDKDGNYENDALLVVVKPRNESVSYNAEFSISINNSWDAFNSDANNRVKLIKSLSMAFGDPKVKPIIVKSIKEGSIIFSWYNRSLAASSCPSHEIMRLRQVMLNENGQLKDSFKKTFKPTFDVVTGSVVPLGACLGGDTPTDGTIGSTDGAIIGPKQEEEEHLITYIVPALIIAIMILMAAIIAVILYRKRRQGKMTMVDNKTFVSKGIPIIFAEELEDKPEPPKNPVIMKDEKPPLPPPEYPRGGQSAEPEELEDYQPPPPFTANRDSNRQNRPKATPTYRKPPPYVPP